MRRRRPRRQQWPRWPIVLLLPHQRLTLHASGHAVTVELGTGSVVFKPSARPVYPSYGGGESSPGRVQEALVLRWSGFFAFCSHQLCAKSGMGWYGQLAQRRACGHAELHHGLVSAASYLSTPLDGRLRRKQAPTCELSASFTRELFHHHGDVCICRRISGSTWVGMAV